MQQSVHMFVQYFNIKTLPGKPFISQWDGIIHVLSLFLLLLPLWSIGNLWNDLFHFSFLILRQSVGLHGRGISPSQGRYLYKQNKRRHISMPWVGFEPTFPVFERAKTVHTLRPHGHCDRHPCPCSAAVDTLQTEYLCRSAFQRGA
jgi:hypothetical protein